MNSSTAFPASDKEPDFIFLARAIALTQSLYMRDFLHEVGQTVGLLTIMERNLTTMALDEENAPGFHVHSDWRQRFGVALSELREAYVHFRAIGTLSSPAASAHDQWAVLEQRILCLAGQSAGRASATIRFARPDRLHGEARDLAGLELVILCFLKESLDQRPAGAPVTFAIEPKEHGDIALGLPSVAVDIEVRDDSLGLVLSETAVAALVAEQAGLAMTVAPDGQSVRMARGSAYGRTA